jgi:hypothetical protein
MRTYAGSSHLVWNPYSGGRRQPWAPPPHEPPPASARLRPPPPASARLSPRSLGRVLRRGAEVDVTRRECVCACPVCVCACSIACARVPLRVRVSGVRVRVSRGALQVLRRDAESPQ